MRNFSLKLLKTWQFCYNFAKFFGVFMIFEDDLFYIQWEEAEIPWLKIFAKRQVKELSDLDGSEQTALFKIAFICEKALIEFYKADKINWASFANYVPKVHLHIMARFKDDSFFPESMWGQKQRQGKNRQLEKEKFEEFLRGKLSKN